MGNCGFYYADNPSSTTANVVRDYRSVPAGQPVLIMLMGGGGGGGGGASFGSGGGGGGNAGAYTMPAPITLAGGKEYQLIAGAAGVAGPPSSMGGAGDLAGIYDVRDDIYVASAAGGAATGGQSSFINGIPGVNSVYNAGGLGGTGGGGPPLQCGGNGGDAGGWLFAGIISSIGNGGNGGSHNGTAGGLCSGGGGGQGGGANKGVGGYGGQGGGAQGIMIFWK